MKSQSNIKPEEIALELVNNDMAEIIFSKNIKEIEDMYEYDEFRIYVPYRENLLDSVKANQEKWLELAKAEENKKVQTKEEEIAELKRENIILGNALDELMQFVLGGEE